MLKQRIITALVLAPLAIAGLVLLEGARFAFFVGAIVVLGAWEWARLAGEEGQKGRIVYALVVALFMIGLYRDAWPAQYLLLPALAWWVVALVLISRYPKGRGLWAGSMISQLFGLLILLPAWYALVWLRALDNGLWLILAVLVLIWAADIGAYMAGKTWGRNKLLPRVSPGKTVEGLAGGLVLTQLLTLSVLLYLGWSPVSLLLGQAAAAAVVEPEPIRLPTGRAAIPENLHLSNPPSADNPLAVFWSDRNFVKSFAGSFGYRTDIAIHV